MADLSNYLKQQYASQLESELAGLKEAYESQRNIVAATNALEKQAFDERANAMGLNTGTGGQAQLARSSAYQRELADLGTAELVAMAKAKADNATAMNNALYAEMLRQDELAAAQAAGGGGEGYDNGSLSTAEVKRMQQFINSGLPANQQIAVDGKWGAETTAAAGASANDFAREYYRQNSWSGRSDR